MLLAVATPMVMMAPVSAGTLIVVSVANRIHAMPASATGRLHEPGPHDVYVATG